ncbi:MAG TPA: VOC family protein [Gemmatimonadales bacterium]|nr:VOC family protein [Gemmatimonadales bacterium]
MATKSKPRPKPPVRRKPESLRVRSVAAALTVRDMPRSLAWYRDVLGFTVDETWEDSGRLAGAGLKAGTARLVLTQAGQSQPGTPSQSSGFRLYFTTAQDIDEVATAIKARGGKLAAEPAVQPWGVKTFVLEDPDGFQLIISSAEEPA